MTTQMIITILSGALLFVLNILVLVLMAKDKKMAAKVDQIDNRTHALETATALQENTCQGQTKYTRQALDQHTRDIKTVKDRIYKSNEKATILASRVQRLENNKEVKP